MCGICGIAGAGASKLKEELAAMTAQIRHRGPDAQGRHFFANCALGHTRLSIIDLQSGDQPMLYNAHRNRLGIVYNGEIYNYKELRRHISLPLHTESDTEVIPALYCDNKADELCRRLVGMFSFALWDDNKQLLFCARDRLGEKPFYYALTPDNKLIFASEARAIIASGLIKPTLSKEAVAEYLAMTYIQRGSCIYARVRQLEPGSYLIWQNDKLTIGRYWTPPLPFEDPPSLEEAAEEIGRLSRQAVSRCLVADVEVGLLLSGGLDSSTVAALASEEKSLRSFSFGIGDKDERPYAKAVAAKYNLPYTELSDAELDLPTLVQNICQVYDEPFGDSSAIPTWLVCGKAREQVKVTLGGDGADELFGGYGWYKPLLKLQGRKSWFGGESLIIKKHWLDMQKFSARRLRQFHLPAVSRPRPSQPSYTLDDALRMDIEGFLPYDVLRKVDRASMSHGLEVRSPFLDADLADFLIALPPEYKVSTDSTKILMRRAFSGLWPDSLKNRPKQGFGYNVGNWLKQPDLHDFCVSYLTEPSRKIYSLLPAAMLKRYAAQTRKKTWLLLLLAIWLEQASWSPPD